MSTAPRKSSRGDRFLVEIEALTPWSDLLEALMPRYLKDERGRPLIGFEWVLRLRVMQQCIGLSDEGAEEDLYDSQAIRQFGGQGTIVDATIITGSHSLKNKKNVRAPNMHQAKKSNKWHFDMKAHIVVDTKKCFLHVLFGTAANVNEVTLTHALMHGEKKAVYADSGHVGVEKREENQGKFVTGHVAMNLGKMKILPDLPLGNGLNKSEKGKASMRAKVKNPSISWRTSSSARRRITVR